MITHLSKIGDFFKTVVAILVMIFRAVRSIFEKILALFGVDVDKFYQSVAQNWIWIVAAIVGLIAFIIVYKKVLHKKLIPFYDALGKGLLWVVKILLYIVPVAVLAAAVYFVAIPVTKYLLWLTSSTFIFIILEVIFVGILGVGIYFVTNVSISLANDIDPTLPKLTKEQEEKIAAEVEAHLEESRKKLPHYPTTYETTGKCKKCKYYRRHDWSSGICSLHSNEETFADWTCTRYKE